MSRQVALVILSVLYGAQAWSSADEKWSAFYLGLEAGVIEKTMVSAPEVENSGEVGAIKAGWTLYRGSLRGDFGFGYRADRMENEGIEVRTSAFLAEAGARIQLGSTQWSLGPQLQLLFGQDVSFSDTGTNSDDRQVSVLGGGRLLYDIRKQGEPSRMRVGVQILTDLDIENRQVSAALITFDWLWPQSQKPKSRVEPKAPAPMNEPIPSVPVAVDAQEPRLKLDLKSVGVTFESGSDELKPGARQVLEQMAKVLIEFSGEWRLIKIDGHTDKTGNYQNNISLSRRRAIAVREVFVQAGVPAERIVARGFGPDAPLINEESSEAFAKNRRVELHLISENASETFVESLKKTAP